MKEQKYGIEEYLKEYEEILNETEPAQGKPTKPRILEELKAKTGLNRIRNERPNS